MNNGGVHHTPRGPRQLHLSASLTDTGALASTSECFISPARLCCSQRPGLLLSQAMGADLSKTRQSPLANHTFVIPRVLTLGQRVAVPAVLSG